MNLNELDLGTLLSFDRKGGVIQFMGQRVLLIDAVSVGLLRTELINRLGVTSARNILTRLGYADGWLAAECLGSDYPELIDDFRFGPAIHTLRGFGTSRGFEFGIDREKHHITAICEESYEAEQHIAQYGRSEEPVCWTLTGWVSGYSSRVAGQETYCIERKCVGKGDAYCLIESRLKKDWGKAINTHLPFFHEETIWGALRDVSTKLRKAERRLWQLQRLFDTDIYSPGIIARSKPMQNVLDVAKRAANVDTSVVVTGESGTGKELIARFIHDESRRAGRPFIAVNCGAVPEALLESEFFGHVKGSFTGADRDRIGLIEAANGGTIFLDEITEMPLGMQAKLLRALQERQIRRVGESVSRPIDFRIIAASNRNLAEEIKAHRFRQDLYYRLCVIEIDVPPLRDRKDDVLPLARFCLDRLNERMGRSVKEFSSAAIEHLLSYNWPGNARELRNVVERALVLCTGNQIGIDDLPSGLWKHRPQPKEEDDVSSMEDIERRHILMTLELTKGNKKLAAKRLNIGLTSLYRKLKKYSPSG